MEILDAYTSTFLFAAIHHKIIVTFLLLFVCKTAKFGCCDLLYIA